MDWITRWVKAALLSLVAGTFVPALSRRDLTRTRACAAAGREMPLWAKLERLDLDPARTPGTGRPRPASSWRCILAAGAGDRYSRPWIASGCLPWRSWLTRPDRHRGSDEALLWSRDAAVYAVFCLTRPGADQSGVAIGCAARDVHNRALERCLRLARTRASAGRSEWPSRLAGAGIVPAATVPEWTALGFDSLQPADEFAINRLAPDCVPRRARRPFDRAATARRQRADRVETLWSSPRGIRRNRGDPAARTDRRLARPAGRPGAARPAPRAGPEPGGTDDSPWPTT